MSRAMQVKMLLWNSLLSSVEAALFFTSDYRKTGLACEWMSATENWVICPKCDKPPLGWCRKPYTMQENDDTDRSKWSLNCPCPSCAFQPSPVSTMTDSTAPSIVYKRKKLSTMSDSTKPNIVYKRKKPITMTDSTTPRFVYKRKKLSTMTDSTSPSFVYKRKKLSTMTDSTTPSIIYKKEKLSIRTDSTRPSFVYMRKKLRGKNSTTPTSTEFLSTLPRGVDSQSVISSNTRPSFANDQVIGSQVKHEKEDAGGQKYRYSKPESINRDCIEEGYDFDPKASMRRRLGVESANDICSSSKSNMNLVSEPADTEVDEPGECSSSSVMVTDAVKDRVSVKEFCINILRRHGLLREANYKTEQGGSAGESINANWSSCSRSCKECGQLGSLLKMLLCDQCEEAYHPSCCNLHIEIIPVDEWFCYSCLKKKRKILTEMTSTKSPSITAETGISGSRSVRSGASLISLMLEDNYSYTTGLRIGKGFQADVPNWSGPATSDDDGDFGEPMEMDPLEPMNLQEFEQHKSFRISSIGNWLQCREVVDDAGNICGKWRRAPLFLLQAENWECFCAVQWDPARADCAVPQELETDEVLRQLKYIETLRPRLAARPKT